MIKSVNATAQKVSSNLLLQFIKLLRCRIHNELMNEKQRIKYNLANIFSNDLITRLATNWNMKNHQAKLLLVSLHQILETKKQVKKAMTYGNNHCLIGLLDIIILTKIACPCAQPKFSKNSKIQKCYITADMLIILVGRISFV